MLSRWHLSLRQRPAQSGTGQGLHGEGQGGGQAVKRGRAADPHRAADQP